jgi:hypothetical protein
MKSKFAKFAQVAVFGLALAFTFSCTSGGDGGDGDGPSLTLSGQVYTYTQEFDEETMNVNMEYIPYTGTNMTFKSNTKGTGSINSGKMSFSTGVPSASILEPISDSDDDFYPDATVQPSNTKGIGLDLDIDLSKQIAKVDLNMITGSMTTEIEAVGYIYVDRDCTITSPGGTESEDGIRYTYQSLNLELKKGWNTVNMNLNMKINMNSGNGTATASMNIGDCSSCKWVLGEDEENNYYYGSIRRKSLPQLSKMAKLGIQQAISANK